MGNIIKLVSESGISIATVKNDLKELENRKFFLEEYKKELTLKNASASMITEDMITELISKSKDFVRNKNLAECRNFIESYIDKVVVFAERVEVYFKIHIPNESAEPSHSTEITPLKSEEAIKALQKEYKVC